jgi:ribosomal protein S18 acetylase RimI-like enzyme
MLTYRTFRNTDPPLLTALWRSCAGKRGLGQPVSPELLEQFLFAKLYFDYPGLVIAEEHGRPLGFAHAGFGPTEEENAVSTELGTTYLVVTRPDCEQTKVAAGLLERTEAYLRSRGAKVLYGGGIHPLNAFYLGLYGGSELPGVLESDTAMHGLFLSHGYQEIDRTIVLERELASFESPIDRRQMQVRRQMIVEVTIDPPARTWWEACTLGEFTLTRFGLVPRTGGPTVARATFRGMELLPTTSRRVMGLIELWVEPSFRRRGLAVFLLSEAFRQFMREGVAGVEAQAMQHNLAGLSMYRKLGFQQVGQGSVLRKEGTS